MFSCPSATMPQAKNPKRSMATSVCRLGNGVIAFGGNECECCAERQHHQDPGDAVGHAVGEFGHFHLERNAHGCGNSDHTAGEKTKQHSVRQVVQGDKPFAANFFQLVIQRQAVFYGGISAVRNRQHNTASRLPSNKPTIKSKALTPAVRNNKQS